MMSILRPLLAMALCVGVCMPLLAVEGGAPTEDRWQPVAAALDAGDDTRARQLLDDIVRDFPRWDHGLLKRAEVHERQDRLETALADAQAALSADPKKPVNASTTARLLVRLGRFDEALAVLDTFLPAVDRGGWTHYYAAEAAAANGDRRRAKDLLDEAVKLSAGAVPAPFRFLAGRIHEADGDYAGAAAAYRRGLGDEPGHASQWFNLGVIERRIAASGAAGAFENAAEAFAQAAKQAPDDPYAWFALGQTHLDLKDFVLADRNLSQAIRRFADAGISDGPELATAHAGYGLAQLRLAERGSPGGDYATALDHLEQAEGLGLADPALFNNLLAAAIGAQREAGSDAEREAFAARAQAVIDGPGGAFISPVNLGLSYYRSAENDAESDPATALRTAKLAAEMLQRGLESGVEDPSAVQRFIGHSHRLAATCLAKIAAASDNPGDLAPERAAALDAAAEAYAMAGSANDGIAQRHYLALQAARGPDTAYAAGWRFLGWRSYLSASGWGVVIGNYGLSGAWKSPISLVVWAVLIGVCLILGLKGFFLPKAPAAPAERPSRRSRPADDARDQAQVTTAAGRRPPRGEVSTERQVRPGTDAQRRKPGTGSQNRKHSAERTTEVGAPPPAPARQRRAVDDVARRMAQQQESPEAQPGTGRTRRSPPRRRR